MVIGLLFAGVALQAASPCYHGGVLTARGTGCGPTYSSIYCATNGITHPWAWDGTEYSMCIGDAVTANWSNSCIAGVEFNLYTTTTVICPPSNPLVINCKQTCSKKRLPNNYVQVFTTPICRVGSCVDPCCGSTELVPFLTCTVQ